MNPRTVIAASRRSKGLIFDGVWPTAFTAAPIHSNGFHESSPLGSIYRSGLLPEVSRNPC